MKIYNKLFKIQIHIIILIFSLGFYTKAFSEENPDVWKFTLDPMPMLVISGNVEKSNFLFIKVNKDCSGSMGGLFSSKNKEKVFSEKGKKIHMIFGVKSSGARINMLEELFVYEVLSEDDNPKATAFISILPLDNVSELYTQEDYNPDGFYMTAPTTKIFDIPYEYWSYNGLDSALDEAIEWCSPIDKMKSNISEHNFIFI